LGGIVCREDARPVPLSRFRLHCGERFRYEYDFTTNWKLDIRLERALQDRVLPSCTAETARRRPKTALEPWTISSDRLAQKPLPIDELKIIAEAVQRFLDSDGNHHGSGANA
jgi:hypothetical protein